MAQELTIIKHPNPILRKVSQELDLSLLKDKDFNDWLDSLELTMKEKDGAGLAAPQVGKNIRIFVIAHQEKSIFFINPKITKRSWKRVVEEEGCLSVVDETGELIFDKVSRHKKINAIYYDRKGKMKKIVAEDFLARVIQHETDHLDGILFIDRVEKDKII